MSVAPKKAKKKKKKNPLIKPLIALGVFLFAAFMWYGFQPVKNTMNYGICKVFIELTLTYPEEVRYMAAFERPPYDVKVDYVLMNEFGEYESRTTTCTFRPDPLTGVALSEVETNRQKLPKEKVDIFNVGIPAILANPPPLNAPGIVTDDLMKLWRSYE